ncbi:hypothetical protein PRJ39_11955 [Lysobacter enzymogenes]|uniref:hypothetical protein n=1 Tax=Lysobacter enzymogenes TaxID=69 RepID=UPI0037494097
MFDGRRAIRTERYFRATTATPQIQTRRMNSAVVRQSIRRDRLGATLRQNGRIRSVSARLRHGAAKKEGPERGLLPIRRGSTLRVLSAALLLVLIVLALILAGTFAILLLPRLALLVALAGIALLARLTGLALLVVAHLLTSRLIRVEATRISRSCAWSG